MSTNTASMQQFGGSSAAASLGGSSAGLVLLYSQSHASLQPVYPLMAREVFIGRDTTCPILVPEPSVSRRHAALCFRNGYWTLRDLGGSNGTIVDGKFISETVLQPQQEIRVGDSIFKFIPYGAEQYLPYRLDGTMVGGASRRAQRLTELLGGYQIDLLGVQLERIAATELSVVIQGESGTGKEVVARELHRLSNRKGPLQAINCAAIPANLIESELFGYKRGAFSGASRDKPGLVTTAHNGTLLLDEIGDMPLEAQAKLLRVIQSREVYPLGATCAQPVDVRFIAATNRDLRRLVAEQRFRGDLLARLNEFSVVLPPLRDRKEDIFLLARSFLAQHGTPPKNQTFSFMLALIHYDWPYNVRELQACLRRAAAICDGPLIDVAHLPETLREAMVGYGRHADEPDPAPPAEPQPPPARRSPHPSPPPTEAQLRQLLTTHRGNVAAVGRELGKERMQIHRWMQRYGIVIDEYRGL